MYTEERSALYVYHGCGQVSSISRGRGKQVELQYRQSIVCLCIAKPDKVLYAYASQSATYVVIL